MREGVRLAGFIGLPTFSRGNGLSQFLFVNGRPVRDKLLLGALRAAYADVMKRDRHPVAALFLTLDPGEVDVNVHPTKAEVRFRDPGLVRGLIVGALARGARERAGMRSSTAAAGATIAAFRPGVPAPRGRCPRLASEGNAARGTAPLRPGFAEAAQAAFAVAPSADADRRGADPAHARRGRSARRGRRSTRPTSSRRPRTGWSSSTSTPRMSAWSMSG